MYSSSTSQKYSFPFVDRNHDIQVFEYSESEPVLRSSTAIDHTKSALSSSLLVCLAVEQPGQWYIGQNRVYREYVFQLTLLILSL